MTRLLSSLALAGSVVVAAGMPGFAGSCTAGSIISQEDAIATASSSRPAGLPITDVSCTTLIRDLSPRYRCTVTWDDAVRQGP